jgi:short-subunit dehydrogenase
LARRQDRIEEVAREVISKGGEAAAFCADVTDRESLEKATQAVLEKWGRIDIVVANAGFAVNGPMAKLSLEDYRRQFETNVFGVLNTIYATREAVLRAGGIIAIMGSIAGRLPMPYNTAYGMSKAAVRALALGLRGELRKKGVSVVLVSPGFVDTEITHVGNDGITHAESIKKMPPRLVASLDRSGTDIVRAILSRKEEVVITGHGKVLVAFNHYLPALYRFLARKIT